MLVYLMRHGDAEPTVHTDAERNLTEKGRTVSARMAKLVAASHYERPEIVIASPLVRAEQTAEIATREFGKALRETSAALRPETPIEAAMSFIASKAKEHRAMMLVSHDPLLSSLASAMLSGLPSLAVEMEKSSIILFEITRFDAPRMKGILRLFLTPDILP